MRNTLQKLRAILLSDRPANQKIANLWWEVTRLLDMEDTHVRQPAICCSMCGALVRLGDRCGCGFTNAWCPTCKKIRVNAICPVCTGRTVTSRPEFPLDEDEEDDRSST